MTQALTKTLRDRVLAVVGRVARRAERRVEDAEAAGQAARDALLGYDARARGRATWAKVQGLTRTYSNLERARYSANTARRLHADIRATIDAVLRDSDLYASGWVAQSMRVGYVRVTRHEVRPGHVRWWSRAWLKGWPARRQVYSRRCLSRGQAMDEGLRNLGRLAKAADKGTLK